MNLILMIGTRIVVLALIFYTVAFILSRKKQLKSSLLVFQSIGLSMDIAATVFMILGSKNTPFTLHGVFGYSALAAMLIETFLLWKQRVRGGLGAPITKGLHLYSSAAYIWWVAAFIIGGLMVLLK
jgi:hypothetical protein